MTIEDIPFNVRLLLDGLDPDGEPLAEGAPIPTGTRYGDEPQPAPETQPEEA